MQERRRDKNTSSSSEIDDGGSTVLEDDVGGCAVEVGLGVAVEAGGGAGGEGSEAVGGEGEEGVLRGPARGDDDGDGLGEELLERERGVEVDGGEEERLRGVRVDPAERDEVVRVVEREDGELVEDGARVGGRALGRHDAVRHDERAAREAPRQQRACLDAARGARRRARHKRLHRPARQHQAPQSTRLQRRPRVMLQCVLTKRTGWI